MVDHYLLKCELYDEEREKLRKKIKVQKMTKRVLLGDHEIIRNTVEYIEKTGRFEQRALRKIIVMIT